MSTVMHSSETADRQWVILDVNDKVLGRVATQIASVLRGKHKPTFTPHAETGDFVIVINAEKIKLTGKKWDDKKVIHHTMFPGGLKVASAKATHDKHPTLLLEEAVRRMLPRTPLGRSLMRKLKIYAGADHPHVAQQPTPMKLVSA